MNTGTYLWWQSALTAALLALLVAEAVRRQGAFYGESKGLAWVMVRILVVVALVLVVRTVWHLVTLNKQPSDALARTSNAAFLGALFLIVLDISSRVARAMRPRSKLTSPIASRVTWMTTTVILVMLLPVFMVGTRALLQSRSPDTKIPREDLLHLASVIAEPIRPGELEETLNSTATELNVYRYRWPQKEESTQILAFHGTRTLSHWLANFSAGSTRLGDCCNVHSGYLNLYADLRPELISIFPELFGRAPRFDKLYIVGHSLGAAMAQLLLYDLSRTRNGASILSRTTFVILGGPTVGDADFLNTFTGSLVDYANVSLPFDPIPALGDTTFVPLDRQVVVMPGRANHLFLASHQSKDYVDALRKPSLEATVETVAFVAGLITLFVGSTTLLFNLKLPRTATWLLVLGIAAIIWQIAVRLGSDAVSSYGTLAAGVAVSSFSFFSKRAFPTIRPKEISSEELAMP